MPCAHTLNRFSLAHVAADYMFERTTPGDRIARTACEVRKRASEALHFAGLHGVGNVQKIFKRVGNVQTSRNAPSLVVFSSVL